MPALLDEKELVSFKEMLMADAIQVDAVSQLPIEKGIITKEDFYNKLKELHREYDKRKGKIV
jgi:hypothetical protein